MAQMSSVFVCLLFFFFTVSAQRMTPPLDPADFIALLRIRNSLRDLHGSEFLSTWNLSSPDPCSSFSGVICAVDANNIVRVSSLTLGTGLTDSWGLTGTISPALCELTALVQLVVYPGKIIGSIPDCIGGLSRLRFISLTNNLFSGTIPTSLAYLSMLHTLDLGYNLLEGRVPPDLTKLGDLKVLILADNRLSGEVPPIESELLHLDLRSNSFSGQLPQLPSTLRYLCASRNGLVGPLTNLPELPDLEFVDLSMNEFNGPIPETLFTGSPQLSTVMLQRNNLSGEIQSVYNPGLLSTVDLSHNFLSGEVPRGLAGAESVYLNNNRLTGVVPWDYVRSLYDGGLKTLYLQHNYLSGFPLPTGTPPPPQTAALCLSYNCMEPPVGPAGCPSSMGGQRSRPGYQCSSSSSAFNTTTTKV
ncbi:DNA damage-repair/toleration protein DRT100-like [Aristolochia californica]|uniref:DNA damage-repair/toleration protein DRT100-like n=1 Tax=Aristolochia californica TaxID=171875 RepID=UPI0035DB2C8D